MQANTTLCTALQLRPDTDVRNTLSRILLHFVRYSPLDRYLLPLEVHVRRDVLRRHLYHLAVKRCPCTLFCSEALFQDRVPMSRIQKRAIHYISQQAEEHVMNLIQDTMPAPAPTHEFHPCKKSLACKYVSTTYITGHAECNSRKVKADRDGRALRGDVKPKNVLSLNRWLSRSAGFQGKHQDLTLAELGMQDMILSHHHRPGTSIYWPRFPSHACCFRVASDFVYRFIRKASAEFHEACLDNNHGSCMTLVTRAGPRPANLLQSQSAGRRQPESQIGRSLH